jgi:mono/diheme cytochrome c family protein
MRDGPTRRRPRVRWKKVIPWVLGGLVALALLIQLVPYGRDHTNPPVRLAPAWDSPQTRALAVQACYDCHSNETIWPWYSNVAPVSWLIQRDVDEGRSDINFSEWDRPQKETDEIVNSVRKGEMAPWTYPITHSTASLSPAERQALVQGLTNTFGPGKPEGDQASHRS